MKRILIAPLDWGLGHAARCIPIVKFLASSNYEVIIASYGASGEFLRREFPQLKHVSLPGMEVKYSTKGFSLSSFFLKLPLAIKYYNNEKSLTSKIIEEYNISLIISDNRYGVCSSYVPSYIITHQTNIKAAFFSPVINVINHYLLRRFKGILIPDFNDQRLSGDLSKTSFKNIYHLGCLSRFRPLQVTNKYKYCALLSGPEPQRSLLEEKIRKIFSALSDPCVIMRGVVGEVSAIQQGNITIYNSLSGEKLNSVLCSSEIIISRSGYSTIMDLSAIGASAILIPTPGQTEQEYLAELHSKNKSCMVVKQSEIKTMSLRSLSLTSFPLQNTDVFKDAISSLLKSQL